MSKNASIAVNRNEPRWNPKEQPINTSRWSICKNFLGEEFEGVISGVASFGFWVETVEHKCEGLVSINSLFEYDDFRLIEGDYSLVGMRSGRRFRMGDKVTDKVIAANLTKRQLDYEWVINDFSYRRWKNA